MRIDEFLLARIAEDEVVARGAAPSPWTRSGHKVVANDHHYAICCTRCGRVQEPVEVVRFHVNADGYRRGPREVVA